MGDRKQTSVLSRNLLQMKFMQRSVLRIEVEKSAEENQRDIDDEHWILDVPSQQKQESKYIIEPSFTVCENLCFGRMSFNGANPEIEKIMASSKAEREYKVSREIERETEVNDKEMAKRYSTLIGIIAKKFAKKRDKNSEASRDDSSSATRSKAKVPKIFPDPKKPKTLDKVKKFLKPSDDDS